MAEPIATGELRHKILMAGVVYGIFFGLMPPYVLTIVVVALRPHIAWLALIVGVVAALKAQWLAVWFTRNS